MFLLRGNELKKSRIIVYVTWPDQKYCNLDLTNSLVRFIQPRY